MAASVCKQFTAFAIMLLYDRGLLQLDEEADKYLPDTMQLPAGITVHQLLCHTSGLHNSYNFEDDFYVGADRLPFNREKFFRDWILKDVVSNPKKKEEALLTITTPITICLRGLLKLSLDRLTVNFWKRIFFLSLA